MTISRIQAIRLMFGDCIEQMKSLADNSVGGVVTDPPYLIGFMNRNWDKAPEGAEAIDEDDIDEVITTEDIHAMEVFHLAWLREVYRVLRPGGVAKVFAATRTMHRLAAAMESIGFVMEPEHSLEAWCYGSGFPKSLNISKALDRVAGAEREVIGYAQGVGGENMNDIVAGRDVRQTTDPGGKGVGAYGTGAKQVAITIPVTAAATEEAKKYEGFGTALKPAWEPFIVGRKPHANV